MCGIVGQLGRWDDAQAQWLTAAVASLEHRGPDDAGTWVDPEVPVLLGHRRLAVIDLTPGGHQPFTSADGSVVLAFNGELYNHVELRRQLEAAGVRFRSTSDTEVLAEAIAAWGTAEALRRSNAMFAVAVWDRRRRVLGLARDRLGEKPLFVQQRGGAVRFASELKALWAGGAPTPPIDRRSLTTYLRLGYVPAPHSVFEGVHKVLPGHITWVDPSGARRDEAWWRPPPVEERPVDATSIDELGDLLSDAVALRSVADVPVGAFLSGGVDSSLVVAHMAAQGHLVRTFTIGFEDPDLDESAAARAVAAHLGTRHTELVVSDDDARAVVPRLARMFDEPMADQSAIPTTLVAELARRDVTVALSGDGGDELFGGYERYRRLVRGAPASLVPSPVARGLAGTGRAMRRVPGLASKGRTLERVGLGVERDGARGVYRSLVSLWERPEEVAGGRPGHPTALEGTDRWPLRRGLVRRAMSADLVTYLPDDLLVKLDRTTMSVALEARVPLLDHRIVAWSRRHAAPTGRSAEEMKAPLRTLLGRQLPPELVDRPKRGFGAPLGAWLRGPLRPWAEDLLDPARLAEGGLLAPGPVQQRWQEHLDGHVDWSYPLWAVLTFQAWREQWSA